MCVYMPPLMLLFLGSPLTRSRACLRPTPHGIPLISILCRVQKHGPQLPDQIVTEKKIDQESNATVGARECVGTPSSSCFFQALATARLAHDHIDRVLVVTSPAM